MKTARSCEGRAAEFQGNDLDNRSSTISGTAFSTHPPSAFDVFELRAWAKAHLVRFGVLDFLDAVDDLQSGAEWSGLIEEIGQDAVQAVMAREFGALQ